MCSVCCHKDQEEGQASVYIYFCGVLLELEFWTTGILVPIVVLDNRTILLKIMRIVPMLQILG